MVSPASPAPALKKLLDVALHDVRECSLDFRLSTKIYSGQYKEGEVVMPVTAKQRRIFEFIRRYIDSNQEAPTIAEIGRQFQMRSSASVHAVLTALGA